MEAMYRFYDSSDFTSSIMAKSDNMNFGYGSFDSTMLP